MPNEYDRRQVLRMAALGAIAIPIFGLPACSSGAGSAASRTIRFSWWGNPPRHTVTKQVLGLFEKKFPNIKVQAEFGGYANYHDKLITEAAGHNAPDLMQIQQAFVSQFASKGILADLKNVKGVKLDAFSAKGLEGGTYSGGLSALSFGDTAPCVFYDVTMLKQAGLKLPAENWTWDDFHSFSGKIQRAIGNGYAGSDDFSGSTWALEMWARQHQNGVGVFTDNNLTLTKQTATAWLQFWADLRKEGLLVSPQIEAEVGGTDDTTPLIRKLAPNFPNMTIIQSALCAMTKNEIGMATFPGLDSGAKSQGWVTGSSWLGIYAGSKAPEETATLLNFLLNDVDAGKLLKLDRGVPVNPEVAAAVKPLLSPLDLQQVNFVESTRNNTANPAYKVPAASAQETTSLKLVSANIAFGKASVSEGVDQFMTDVTKALTS